MLENAQFCTRSGSLAFSNQMHRLESIRFAYSAHFQNNWTCLLAFLDKMLEIKLRKHFTNSYNFIPILRLYLRNRITIWWMTTNQLKINIIAIVFDMKFDQGSSVVVDFGWSSPLHLLASPFQFPLSKHFFVEGKTATTQQQ